MPRPPAYPREESRDQHRNPKNIRSYLRRLLAPERDAWQQPDRVVKALGLKKGSTVAEIGAGPGYFTLRLARVVGKSGSVLAVEVEPKLIVVLRDRLREQRVSQVVPVLGFPDDPLLPLASCDAIVAVNVFHHVADLPGYLKRLARSLKPGGFIADIDFQKVERPVGPPVDHVLARDETVALARRAGLRLSGEHDFLPYQYFLLLAPRRS